MFTVKTFQAFLADPWGALTLTGKIVLPIALVFAVLNAIAWCRIFTKASQPWWKVFIPIYGIYSCYGIADCEVICCFNLISSFIFLPLLNADMPVAILSIYLIFIIVLHFVFCACLAGSFRKNILYAIGLFLFMPVLLMELGFGSNTYHFGEMPDVSVLTRLFKRKNISA